MDENTSIILPVSLAKLKEALLQDFRQVFVEEIRKLNTTKDVYVKTIEELSQYLTDGSDKSYSRPALLKALADPEIAKGCIGESKEGLRIYNATKFRNNLIKSYDRRVFKAK